MEKILKNKHGSILPRDIIFMMITFAGIIAFASVLVNQMGAEYENENMTSTYSQETIGKDSLEDTTSDWKEIGDDLSGENGVVAMLGGGLSAIGTVLKEVLLAPHNFSKMLISTLDIVGASDEFQNLAGYFLSGILYVIIIFGIIKVFLRGGDI